MKIILNFEETLKAFLKNFEYTELWDCCSFLILITYNYYIYIISAIFIMPLFNHLNQNLKI